MVKIRRVEGTDSEAVKELILKIMDEEFHEDKAAFSTADIDRLAEAYGGLGEAFFVAENSGHIVGTVGVKREDDRNAFLRRIFVAPAYRKKRIGSELIKRAIDFCHEVGYQELIFKTTSHMKGACELVQNHGFHLRAKVPMGQLELLKFSLPLKGKSS